MSIFTEYSCSPRKTVFVTEILFRIALFYSVCTMIFGVTALFEAPWVAAFDDQLAIVLAQDGTLFLLMSAWFGALAAFFQQRPYGVVFSAEAARLVLFLQFAIFAWAMWPLTQG